MPADKMISVFRDVGLYEIVVIQMQRDSNGDMHVVLASRDHPQG